MSNFAHHKNSFLERIFSSRVRIQLLSHFLLHPESRDHIRALSSMINAQYNAVWKELNNLEAAGLLRSEKSGGRKIYSLNRQSSIVPELRSILLKTVAVGDFVREGLGELEGLELAFIFGSFASGEIDPESDLDLMLIGDVDVTRIAPVIDELQNLLAREINYVCFSREDWEDRLENGDPFVENVRGDPKVILIGEENEL
jgi:predicted nucleotidyltransferase